MSKGGAEKGGEPPHRRSWRRGWGCAAGSGAGVRARARARARWDAPVTNFHGGAGREPPDRCAVQIGLPPRRRRASLRDRARALRGYWHEASRDAVCAAADDAGTTAGA
jgi:hypothetical protein